MHEKPQTKPLARPKTRAKKPVTKKPAQRSRKAPRIPEAMDGNFSQEALMTIIAIMKDHDDPKLQMAAAKMLLDKHAVLPTAPMMDDPNTPNADELDAAIALAKTVLDELASRKAQELDGAGAVVVDSAASTDQSQR